MQYISSAHTGSAKRTGTILLLCLSLTSGAALAGVVHTVNPTTFDYGDQLVGTASSAQTFTFTNESGVSTINVTSVDLSGTNVGDFSIDSEDCTAGGIGPGATCDVDVSFGPTATGARSAALDFTVDFGAAPTATLDGTGIQPAVGLDTASPLDLGSWNVGATSTAATVTLENTGTADLNVGTLGISGTDAGDYTLGGNTCDSAVLTPASTCTFQVTLTPSAGGTRTAQVDIPSDAPTSVDVLELTGTGVVVGPAVDLNPTSIDFGGHAVGVPSSATQVTLENVGNQTLNVGTLAVSGTNLGDFVLGNDNCSDQAVDAGNTCTFDVTFTAGAQGARSAQVDIPSDAPSTPDAVPVSGSGLGQSVSVDPTSIDFGAQPVDVPSTSETVTYSNTGTLPVNVGTVGVSGGAKGSVFAVSADTCTGQEIAAGNDCSFDVTFTPASPAAASGTVSIPSDAPGSPHLVTLSGTGIPDNNDFVIGAGMSGSFFDPAFAGQGLNIEIIAGQAKTNDGKGGIPGLAVVYWYSFGPDGFPLFAFGVGNVVGNKINVNMLMDYDGNGPFFGPNWQASQFFPRAFADATITALGCDDLLFEFLAQDPDAFTEHVMVMERITDVAQVPCNDSKSDFVTAREDALKGDSLIAVARTGSFYSPPFNGQGLNIEVLTVRADGSSFEGEVVIYWYSFDNGGSPFFAFGVGSYRDEIMTARLLVDLDGAGPTFGPGWNPAEFVPVPFADIRLEWDGCESADMTFDMLGPFSGIFDEHPMQLIRITTVLNLGC